MSDYALDDFRSIPDLSITNGASPGEWVPLDLTDPTYSIQPEPPSLVGLIYNGRRHVISGPPESAKTLVGYICLITAIRAGEPVAIIDFEMGPIAARRMLEELGATTTELSSIYFVAPDNGPQHGLQQVINHRPGLVLIDAAIGAYDASGLDDNARKDAQAFARIWIDPLWKEGITTLLVDHVTKNTETRGKFSIGSERKLGAADVHLGLETVKTMSRGTTGMIKVAVHKDRPGFLQRPHATVIDLSSSPDTHHITWAFRDPHPTDAETGEFRPTALMEKVSRLLETTTIPLSRNEVEQSVKGKRDFVRAALDILTREEFLVENQGARGARMMTSIQPYRRPPDDLAPTSPHLAPGEDKTTSPHLAPPLQGDEVAGRGQSGEETNTTSPPPGAANPDPDIDEQDQALIDYYTSLEHSDDLPL